MKLYITPSSPYARAVRIVVHEKSLDGRIESILAQTRVAGSPYYGLNPSGRVPYLVRDDGSAMEDSQVIAAYLDGLDDRPSLCLAHATGDWAYGRLEGYARSMTDGISVWVREMRRPAAERSPTILAHEAVRAARIADFWEGEIVHPMMQGPLNLAQVLLLVGIDFAAYHDMADYAAARPRLAAWLKRLHARPSVRATAPPPK